jgi:glycosyltransferase involved in cell wall biosynthesis
MTRPTVTVIIPAYNRERFIRCALDSVFAQTYPICQVIVVDDGSTDRTAQIAHCYPQVTLLSRANGGPSVARNDGLSAANGEVIAFLDSDDVWLPNKIETQMQVLTERPDVGYVLCRMRAFCEEGFEMAGKVNLLHYASDPPARLPSALLVRRSVMDEVGHFDPCLRTAEDADWFARATDLGIVFHTVDEVLLEKRVHPHNISFTDEKDHTNLIEALRRSIARKSSGAKHE